MTRADEKKWVEQAKELLNSGASATHDLPPFAVSMLTYFYGASSAQLRAHNQRADNVYKDKGGMGPTHALFMHARGTVSNLIRELEHNLVGSIRSSIQGEVLGDLIGLAKEALSSNTDEAKNVAAVLAAAAFEDCVRRLGIEKAGIQDRPKLENVLGALKDAGILNGGAVSLANSMLKFRNDSLHADWQQVTRAQIESCLALTESLLREHFS
jgi:hypothetical protein